MLPRKFATNVFRVLFIFVVVVQRNKTNFESFVSITFECQFQLYFYKRKLIDKHEVYLSCRKTKQNKTKQMFKRL